MSQPGAPLTLRRFFDRVVRRRLKVYVRPEYAPPDLPFFRHLITEW